MVAHFFRAATEGRPYIFPLTEISEIPRGCYKEYGEARTHKKLFGLGAVSDGTGVIPAEAAIQDIFKGILDSGQRWNDARG